MIAFDEFKIEDGSPLYAQIIRYVKRGIIAGSIREGDELPSRRVLSALLGVNPNTVQKAYRLLEEEGLIESRSGAKSYVTAGEEQAAAIRGELLETDAGRLVAAMQQMGVSKEEAFELLERLWERRGDGV